MSHTAKGVSLIALALSAIIGLPQPVHTQSCTKFCDPDFRKHSDTPEINSIIQSEEDYNIKSGLGYSPIHLAAGFTDYPSVIKAWLDTGADLGEH